MPALRLQQGRAGRMVVMAAIDGQAAGLVAIAGAPRPTAKAAVDALHQQGVAPEPAG